MQEAAQAVVKFEAKGMPDSDAVLAQYKSWGITAELKLHQAEGVAWLIGRFALGVNVILGKQPESSQFGRLSMN